MISTLFFFRSIFQGGVVCVSLSRCWENVEFGNSLIWNVWLFGIGSVDTNLQIFRYTCCYCSWSGVDNWCLKRHLNTHLKPFACTLCEYKAARAERLATHVLKVHNRRQCSRCSFLGEDAAQLQMHQLHVHRVSSANAPATSTAQAVPPPNNRHQQPLQ